MVPEVPVTIEKLNFLTLTLPQKASPLYEPFFLYRSSVDPMGFAHQFSYMTFKLFSSGIILKTVLSSS